MATFEGDNNEVLIAEQTKLYPALIASLVFGARKKFIDACWFVGYRSDFLEQLIAKNTFEAAFYFPAYNVIATWYRCKYADRVPQLHLPYPEENVPKEISKNKSLEMAYATEWSDFWHKEIEILTDDGKITQALVKALVFEGDPAGSKALKLLVLLLEDRYNIES